MCLHTSSREMPLRTIFFVASLVSFRWPVVCLVLVSGYTLIGNLEHRAISVRSARLGCAEEVAFGVGDQAGFRIRAVGIVEGDQGGWCACIAARGLGDLEHRARLQDAPPVLGCAEEVTPGVEDQAPKRWTSPIAFVEAARALSRSGRKLRCSPPQRLIVRIPDRRYGSFDQLISGMSCDFSFRFLRAGPRPRVRM